VNKDDVMYGQDGWELLEHDPDMALGRILEEACGMEDKDFNATADRIEWPIRILVFKRMDTGGEGRAQHIAEYVLEMALDNLDQDYGGDEITEKTQAMKDAALRFGRVVVAEYVPWNCEPSGEVIEYTREQVRKLEEGDA